MSERQRDASHEDVGRLARGVAHDVNNLVGVIATYTHFVSEAVAAAAAGDVRQPWDAVGTDVEEIARAAERVSRLTGRLVALDWRTDVRPEAIDLHEVALGLLVHLRGPVGERIEIVVAGASGVVAMERAGLEHALVEVVTNAREATPAGGRVTIEIATVGGQVELHVSDTGTGVAPEVLDRAFEPFATTKSGGDGAGLGLTGVRAVVARSGGTVELTSTAGQGTRFTARFPECRDAASPVKEDDAR